MKKRRPGGRLRESNDMRDGVTAFRSMGSFAISRNRLWRSVASIVVGQE